MSTFATATIQLWSRLARDTAGEAWDGVGSTAARVDGPPYVLPNAEGRRECRAQDHA
jgi:hypothetical protein